MLFHGKTHGETYVGGEFRFQNDFKCNGHLQLTLGTILTIYSVLKSQLEPNLSEYV